MWHLNHAAQMYVSHDNFCLAYVRNESHCKVAVREEYQQARPPKCAAVV